MSDDQELDLTIAGQHVRTKGYRLMDLIWLPVFLGVLYSCLLLYQQQAAAATDKKDNATAMKENNATVVNAIKESNQNTLSAIRDLATEQRRSTNAMKEVACLSDPAMRNRSDAREFCKRISRDDR